MNAESIEALAGTLTILAGFGKGTVSAVRKDKARRLTKIEAQRAAEIAEVEQPFKEEIANLRTKIRELQAAELHMVEMAVQTHQDRINGLIEGQQEAIRNAIQGCQAELNRMVQDRDYWRGVAMGRAVSLEKQDDTDHDNREDTP